MRPQKHMSKQITVLGKRVESKILLIRGQRVILDTDLAELYGVSTKQLNQQVKRNVRRFPDDFVMQLSAEEAANLRSQIVTSSSSHGGQRYRPYAFTEHGAIMAASVLRACGRHEHIRGPRFCAHAGSVGRESANHGETDRTRATSREP